MNNGDVATGFTVTDTKIYMLSFARISIFENWLFAFKLPSTFILKEELPPPASPKVLIFRAELFRLKIIILEVALPIVVKTVSKVNVSVEKLSLSFGLVEKISSLQAEKLIDKTIEMKRIIVKDNLPDIEFIYGGISFLTKRKNR